MISTWWIGPLIIFVIKRSSRFVSFHALQALFWQIIFTLLHACGMILMFATASGIMASMPQQKTADPPFPTALFVVMPFFWLMMMGGFATLLTPGIIYCLKAMRGEWAGYPLISRWAERIVRNKNGILIRYDQTTETNRIDRAGRLGLSSGNQRQRHRSGPQTRLRPSGPEFCQHAD
jgi:uncharacterized membrane protein